MNSAAKFTKNIAGISYNDFPAEVKEGTKKQILDTLGAIVAGSASRDIRRLVDLTREWGGKAESTIFGFGGKVPCCDAALINGFSASVLDFDEVNILDFIPASRGVIPAAFAIAERKGAVNGKEFITAVVLGYDLACRISRAAFRTEGTGDNALLPHTEAGLLTAPNVFGAAAAAGKILGLDEKKLKDAFGIALLQIGTEGQAIREGLNTKGLDFGLRPRAGVLAALLAEKGFQGTADPIEGQWGFYAQCYRNVYTPTLLTSDLGKTFEITKSNQRQFPCSGANQVTLSATLALVNEDDINPDEVMEVILRVGPVANYLCEPLEQKRKPGSAIEAQFSLPWLVAKAILYRRVGIEHFTDEQLRDTKTLEMADKIIPEFTPELKHTPLPSPEAAIVEIRTKDGEIHSKRADFSHGDLDDPMSFGDVAEKFKDCCQHSAQSISKDNQNRVIAMVEHLEDITDVGQIAELLG